MANVHKGLNGILQKYPGDVVILSALRTPITRAYKGGLCNAYPEQMLAAVLKATLTANPNLPPHQIQEISVGTVLSELGGSKAGRMAACHVGYPETTSLHTVNRACASSLQAITAVADAITTNRIDCGIGAGMESMTRNYESKAIPVELWPKLRESPSKDARDCIMAMGTTSENIAKRYGVTREDQDKFAVSSHRKASEAQKKGLFDDEIVPMEMNKLAINEPQEGHLFTFQRDIITKDDGIRHSANMRSMAMLKPAFEATGTSTAGNSSQISDGAAAVLMMRRSTANELGLSSAIMGKWVSSQFAGVAPDEMGIGPAVAIPRLLAATGIRTEDVGIWEINEAFASQALYCIRLLGLDMAKVNPKGGGIALGHPLGATGARQVSTLLPEMKRQQQQVGVVSMCVGTGMGMASLFIRE
ncbi:MAG: hypothetical protein HETSPECPRED_002675 [Heterodermia speciosa]|uniref:acetyl-CoA C-acyltransferase n=1 Tax=Heterodermia speciosa TaxID=116794 RepID=A0A8H3PI96_9LECA|nr:MAG: hypothetical protein HETSPECPRED_002675 [Heterodermia speciosa]